MEAGAARRPVAGILVSLPAAAFLYVMLRLPHPTRGSTCGDRPSRLTSR